MMMSPVMSTGPAVIHSRGRLMLSTSGKMMAGGTPEIVVIPLCVLVRGEGGKKVVVVATRRLKEKRICFVGVRGIS